MPNELAIAAYGFIMLVQTLPESKLNWNSTASMCMNLITVCWIMNMVCSSLVSAYGIYIKIRDYIRKRRAQATSRVYTIKTGIDENEKDINQNMHYTVDFDIDNTPKDIEQKHQAVVLNMDVDEKDINQYKHYTEDFGFDEKGMDKKKPHIVDLGTRKWRKDIRLKQGTVVLDRDEYEKEIKQEKHHDIDLDR